MIRIGRTVVPVRDYDSAIAFYERAFGFRVLFDERLDDGFRAVHVGPGAQGDPGLWLMTDSGEPRDDVALVLYTDDLLGDLARIEAMGAAIVRPPYDAGGSRQFHLHDDSGNEIVLVRLETDLLT